MGQAFDIDNFLFPGSGLGESYTFKTLRNSKKAARITLQILGYAVLATFGIWPGLAYLFYMAMTT